MLAKESCRLLFESEIGSKYVCPPFDTQTSILILRKDGTGEFKMRPDAI
jgi:hypothetical protein